MKYIIFEDSDGVQIPVVTSELVGHDFVAACFETAGMKPISAGFCSFGVDKNGDRIVSVWGKSVSLNLDSNSRGDAGHLYRMYNGDA